MYRVPERIYRTVTGRLVRHGHPEAAFLAFPVGMELSDEEATRLGVLAFAMGAAVQGKPMDKMAARTGDKSERAAPTAGLVASLEDVAPVAPSAVPPEDVVVVGPVGAAMGVEVKPAPIPAVVEPEPVPTARRGRSSGSRYAQ